MTAIASLRVEVPAAREVGAQPALSALRGAAWFAGWPAQALAALSVNASLRSFGPGQSITADGKGLQAAVLVVKGRIRSARRADGGRELTLESFREGDLAVDGLLEQPGLPTEWLASETSLLLFIPREDFLAQVRTIPEAALALARDLERRLGRSKTLASGLVLADVETRLYRALVDLARGEGEQTPEGTVIARSPTQQELGNGIGACRETVSRIIAELSRQGMVALRGRRLTLAPRFFELAKAQGLIPDAEA